MPVVAVINRKGGSGKSTLATHLAAWCANAGIPAMLGDVDRQQSTQAWLKRRAARKLPGSAPIVGWAVDARKSVLRPPSGITHVVLDTPGGLRDFELAKVVMAADLILMPVCNSAFDRESAAECHAELMTLPRVASGRCKVAAVGMRLDARTRGGEVLEAWARELNLPFIGVLRETQTYVRCVEQGLAVFDLPPDKVQADLAQWQPILAWLAPVLRPVPPDAAATSARPSRPAGLRETPDRAPMTARARVEPPRPKAVAVAERQHQVPAGVLEGAPRSGIARRMSSLFGWLPLPRFLQRNL